jgi:hypothetical protein
MDVLDSQQDDGDIDDEPPFRINEVVDLDLFQNVETLVITEYAPHVTDIGTWETRDALRELRDWIKKRKVLEAPVTIVMFKDCTPHLQPFFEHLSDEQAALQVTWEESKY